MMFDSTTAVLLAIMGLTVLEVGAVVAVVLFGPHGEQSALIGTLIGIVGPVVTSFLAMWNAMTARKEVQAMRQDPPAVPTPAPPSKAP